MTEPNLTELGRVLRERTAYHNKAELARKIGVSANWLYKVEAGQGRLRRGPLVALARELDLDPVEVLHLAGYDADGLSEPPPAAPGTPEEMARRLRQVERELAELRAAVASPAPRRRRRGSAAGS